MGIIESFAERTRGKNLSVVFPEGRDERVIRAARRLKDDSVAEPIVLGSPGQIEAAVEKAEVGLDGI
ncbi:phosphate acetyltransferase, partial [bacterium]